MRPTPQRIRAALAPVVLCAFVACARVQSAPSPEDETDLVTLNIVNHHPLDVVIYNVAQGHRDRLGQVTAASNGSFTLHLRRVTAGDVRFYADPIGASRGVTSDLVHVSPGDIIDWTLETDLARSHLEVR